MNTLKIKNTLLQVRDALKTKRGLALSLVAAVVIVVIGIIAFFLVNSNKEVTVEKKILNSQVGSSINEITTVDGQPAASIVIAPPTQKWWDILLGYTTHTALKDIPFEQYGVGAEYISYTMSPGGEYESQGSIALPTTFIVYESEAAAEVVQNLINEKGGLAFQRTGNIIFFVPDGAFVGVDYAEQQFANSKARTDKAELELNDEALMMFSFRSFSGLYTAGLNENDFETFDTTLALLGMTNQTTWSGLSDDGLTWKGSFSNTDFSTVNEPSSIADYLSTRAYYLDIDGEVKLTSEATEENQTGVQYSAQSLLTTSGSLGIRSNTGAVGVDEDDEKLKPLPASEGVYQVSINVNEWLSIMRSGDMILPYTSFDTLTITALNASGDSTLTLTPVTVTDDTKVEEEASE